MPNLVAIEQLRFAGKGKSPIVKVTLEADAGDNAEHLLRVMNGLCRKHQVRGRYTPIDEPMHATFDVPEEHLVGFLAETCALGKLPLGHRPAIGLMA